MLRLPRHSSISFRDWVSDPLSGDNVLVMGLRYPVAGICNVVAVERHVIDAAKMPKPDFAEREVSVPNAVAFAGNPTQPQRVVMCHDEHNVVHCHFVSKVLSVILWHVFSTACQDVGLDAKVDTD